jgi:hypothetical protein
LDTPKVIGHNRVPVPPASIMPFMNIEYPASATFHEF